MDSLVDKEHAAKNGTGFFVNDKGQLLTAAHVVHNCAVIEVRNGGFPLQTLMTDAPTVTRGTLSSKNFFSGLLSVGTLGLSPVVMSGEYTFHYELYVNGQRLAR